MRDFVYKEGKPTTDYRSRMPLGENLSKKTRIILLLTCLLVGFFDSWLHGWGYAAAPAAIALIAPVIGYRKFWHLGRFWITAILLTALQIPLVILLRPTVEKFRFIALLSFAVADCVVITLALSWICSQAAADSNDQS
jgi:hypothetical protein